MEKNLSKILNNFSNYSIVTLGDIMLDRYIWGDVDRISPEAPVPVVHTQDIEYRIGGAGNVAANLSSLNCNSTIFSVTGEDSNASLLEQLLSQKEIQPKFEKDSDRPTTVKSRIVSQQQQLLRIDHEDPSPVSQNIINNCLERLHKLNNIDAIIISDYDKGFISEHIINKISNEFNEIPIITDPKISNWDRYQGSTIIKPNFHEFCQAIGKDNIPFNKIEIHASKMADQYNLDAIIVTLGKHGVFYYTADQTDILPTEAHEVYDVSGAGDTFTAAFTAGLLTTQNIKEAAQIGNIAAGVAVEKVGTATVSSEEILQKSQLKN